MKIRIKTFNIEVATEILSVGLIIFLAYLLLSNNTPSLEKYNNSDIHRGFQRAVSISQGVNPYLEFNPELMLEQEKVPGFFPLYFHAMSVIARLADYSFVTYLDILRRVIFIAYISLGLAIYILMKDRGKLLALTSSAIFMFNRWTVNDVIDLKQDTYVILLLFLSLSLLKTHTKTSFFLYGIATGIKHITILAFPVYLFEFLQLSKQFRKNFYKILFSFVLLVSPLLIPSLPFLTQSPRNFINALVYNGTRLPEASGIESNSGLNKMLVLYNQDRFNSPFFYALPRIPLVLMILFCVIALLKGHLNTWQYCALAYLSFIALNPVLYGQYFTWLFAFVPFLLPTVSRKSNKPL